MRAFQLPDPAINPIYHRLAGADLAAADVGGREAPGALMEKYLERGEVIAFLADLGDALEGFVRGMEQFTASRQGALGGHALLALEHGIAIHRASLEWVESAMAALGEISSVPDD